MIQKYKSVSGTVIIASPFDAYIQLGYELPKMWAKSKKERRRIGRRIRKENRQMKKDFGELPVQFQGTQ